MSRESDSAASAALALVHEGWNHLRLQRPLAAWGSWQRATRVDPEHKAAREALAVLEAASDLPEAARIPYRFRQPETEERRQQWDRTLRGKNLEDLTEAAAAFASLAEQEPTDGAAAFNQGLCLAWAGRNAEAVAALDRSVERDARRETTFEQAVRTAALAEVLRHGAGAETLADDLTHTLILRWPEGLGDPAVLIPTCCGGVFRALPAPEVPAGVSAVPSDPRQVFEWLDRNLPAPSEDLALAAVPWVRAGVVVQGDVVRLSSPRLGALWAAERDLHLMLGDQFQAIDRHTRPLPLTLLDSAAWQFRLPPDLPPATRHRLLREAIEHWHENELLVIPRQALVGSPPPEGRRFPRFRSALPGEPAGSDPTPQTSHVLGQPITWCPDQAAWAGYHWDDPVARARLLGFIRLREQLSLRPQAQSLYAGYPFDRLRFRLGLEVRDTRLVEDDEIALRSEPRLSTLELDPVDAASLADVYRSAAWACESNTLGRIALALVTRDPTQAASLDVPALFEAAVGAVLDEDGAGAALELVDRLIASAPDQTPSSTRNRLALRRAVLLDQADAPDATTQAVALIQSLRDADPLLTDAIVALEDRLPAEVLQTALQRLANGAHQRGLRGQEQFAQAWLTELDAHDDDDAKD